MEFYRITSESEALFRPLYAMYQKSFPLHEQRLPRHQVEALADPAYHFEAIIENGQLAGLIGYWLTEAFAYIEHFAVSPELRGRALGSGALEEFGRRHPLVILEIDPPEDELSIRRERFYRRLGFQSNDYPHLHPAYRDNFEPHRLVIMTSPRKISVGEYQDFNRYLAETVMGKCERAF